MSESLPEAGSLWVIPERPKRSQPEPPKESLERALENTRGAFQRSQSELRDLTDPFLERYETPSEEITPIEELFSVGDVGGPGERETRALSRDADRQVDGFTERFEYFDRVRPAVRAALDRGITLRALLVDPEHLAETTAAIRAEIVGSLANDYPEIDLR